MENVTEEKKVANAPVNNVANAPVNNVANAPVNNVANASVNSDAGGASELDSLTPRTYFGAQDQGDNSLSSKIVQIGKNAAEAVGVDTNQHIPQETVDSAVNLVKRHQNERVDSVLETVSRHQQERAAEAAAAKASAEKPSESRGEVVFGAGHFGTLDNRSGDKEYEEWKKNRELRRRAKIAGDQAAENQRRLMLESGMYFDDGRGNIKKKKQFRGRDERGGTIKDDGAAAAARTIQQAGQARYDSVMGENNGFTSQPPAANPIVEANRKEAEARQVEQRSADVTSANRRISVFEGLVAAQDALSGAEMKYATDRSYAPRDDGKDARFSYDENGRVTGMASMSETKSNKGYKIGFVGKNTIDAINQSIASGGNVPYRVSRAYARQDYDALGNAVGSPVFYVRTMDGEGRETDHVMTQKQVYEMGRANYAKTGLSAEDAEEKTIKQVGDIFGRHNDPKYMESVLKNERLKAETERTKSDAQRIDAETGKTNAETEAIQKKADAAIDARLAAANGEMTRKELFDYVYGNKDLMNRILPQRWEMEPELDEKGNSIVENGQPKMKYKTFIDSDGMEKRIEIPYSNNEIVNAVNGFVDKATARFTKNAEQPSARPDPYVTERQQRQAEAVETAKNRTTYGGLFRQNADGSYSPVEQEQAAEPQANAEDQARENAKAKWRGTKAEALPTLDDVTKDRTVALTADEQKANARALRQKNGEEMRKQLEANQPTPVKNEEIRPEDLPEELPKSMEGLVSQEMWTEHRRKLIERAKTLGKTPESQSVGNMVNAAKKKYGADKYGAVTPYVDKTPSRKKPPSIMTDELFDQLRKEAQVRESEKIREYRREQGKVDEFNRSSAARFAEQQERARQKEDAKLRLKDTRMNDEYEKNNALGVPKIKKDRNPRRNEIAGGK